MVTLLFHAQLWVVDSVASQEEQAWISLGPPSPLLKSPQRQHRSCLLQPLQTNLVPRPENLGTRLKGLIILGIIPDSRISLSFSKLFQHYRRIPICAYGGARLYWLLIWSVGSPIPVKQTPFCFQFVAPIVAELWSVEFGSLCQQELIMCGVDTPDVSANILIIGGQI